MKITLGVLDVPYNKTGSYLKVGRKSRPRRQHIRRGADITTGQLADILEEQYGITNFFLEQHGQEFIADILEGHAQNLTRPARGTGSRTDHMQKAVERGEKMFRDMLESKELDGQRAGVPTQRSIKGYRTGRSPKPGRPSFIDTGLYRDSFRIDVEDE